MYHGDMNERQRLELHMVRKEGGRENGSELDQLWGFQRRLWLEPAHFVISSEGMDQWLLAVTGDPAAKGSAKDLEVAGASPSPPHFPYHV